jgi:hypothetical protein
MQEYNKSCLVAFITLKYNGLIEASKQGYRKESVGLYITVNYNN